MKNRKVAVYPHGVWLFALLFSVLLASCGGGGSAQDPGGSSDISPGSNTDGQPQSGSSANPVSSQDSFKIKFIGNIDSRRPVSGVTVSLYRTGSQDPLKTIVTDVSGVADFSDMGPGKATLIYGYEVEEHKTVTLSALVDYEPGYLEIPTGSDPLEVAATVDVEFSGDHGEAIVGSLDPIFVGGLGSINGDVVSFSDVKVYKLGVQLDGRVSFLAQAMGAGSEPYKRYGFVLDQDLEEGKSYTGTFDYNYEPFSWSSDRYLERGVGQSLYREGVQFASLGGVGEAGYEGQQKAISEFPADIHVYSASSTTTDSGFTETRASQIMTDAFPTEELEFKFADFYLTDVVFADSPDSYSISWVKNGSDPATVLSIADSRTVFSDSSHSEVLKTYNLGVAVSPEASEFAFPRLEGDLKTWFTEFQQVPYKTQLAALWFYPNKPGFGEYARASMVCYGSLSRDAECIRAGFFKDSYNVVLAQELPW